MTYRKRALFNFVAHFVRNGEDLFVPLKTLHITIFAEVLPQLKKKVPCLYKNIIYNVYNIITYDILRLTYTVLLYIRCCKIRNEEQIRCYSLHGISNTRLTYWTSIKKNV